MSSPEKLLKPLVARWKASGHARNGRTNEKRWIDPNGPHNERNAKPWGLAYLRRQDRREALGIHSSYEKRIDRNRTKINDDAAARSEQSRKIDKAIKKADGLRTESGRQKALAKATDILTEPSAPQTVVAASGNFPGMTIEGLEAMKVTDLKGLATSSGQITGASKMKKAELVSALADYLGLGGDK